MTTILDTPGSSWLPSGHEDSPDPASWVTFSAFERTGASTEQLARDTREEIMGYEAGSEQMGYKPPRADIAKYKEAYDLWVRKNRAINRPDGEPDFAGEKEWDKRFEMSVQERGLVSMYSLVLSNGDLRGNPEGAFEFVAKYATQILRGAEDDETDPNTNEPPSEEGKKLVGQALKKYEQMNWPTLYVSIKKALELAHIDGPESYKLWPWMVKQIKDRFQRDLMVPHHIVHPSDGRGGDTRILPGLQHIVDVATEGGSVLNKLRADNRIPQNFDVNKMGFDDFEKWLMDWKKENRGSEAQGHVVYEFHDGWTIQKLTTPEQLQFEGDEMGHCVGGYSAQVEDGQTIIYSLRDKEGKPHVTMEIEGQMGSGPTDIEPADEEELAENGLELTFQVVQVQGNGNLTPKPEYQRKIKEFLDSLRAKGWKFERSASWYGNYDADDEDGRGYGQDDLDTARELQDWYSDHYRGGHEKYQTGTDDAYGMPSGRKGLGISWERMMHDCVWSLVSPGWHGDRSQYHTSDWEGLAQATYHAYMIDVWKDHLSEVELARHKANFEEERESEENKLHEQISEHFHDYNPDQIIEKAEELAGKQGVELSDEAREDLNTLRDEHEDLYYEAFDEVQRELEEWAVGDAYKYLGYLYMLVEHQGAVNPADLPEPHLPNGGLPSYEELIEHNSAPNGDVTQTEFDKQQKAMGIPGAFSHWVEAASPYTIVPIDEAHNVWFDEDGESHPRYRPSWQAPRGRDEKMTQDGPPWDTFLDQKGRQAQGFVAYHGADPVGSVTYVDEGHRHMLGTAYVHPNHREQGLFNQLVAPLRASGKPIDAYVWNNPWLQEKVRNWRS